MTAGTTADKESNKTLVSLSELTTEAVSPVWVKREPGLFSQLEQAIKSEKPAGNGHKPVPEGLQVLKRGHHRLLQRLSPRSLFHVTGDQGRDSGYRCKWEKGSIAVLKTGIWFVSEAKTELHPLDGSCTDPAHPSRTYGKNRCMS